MRAVIGSNKRKFLQGYTLVEMAIVMSVAGIMIAAFATAYNIYLKTQQQLTTENNMTAVMGAVSNFLIQNGAYPCPARANAQRSDADYGISTQCDPAQTVDNGIAPAYPLTVSYPCSAASPGNDANNNPLPGCTLGAHGAGTCSDGLCWQTSDRVPALAKPLVRRGMIPFRTLGLAEEYSLDGYNSRFQYAVTEALAVPGTYSIANGGIDILNESGVGMVKPPSGFTGGSAHFVLFSAGLDRAGAYSRDGVQVFPCATVGLDAMNCTTNAANQQATYRFAPYSETHVALGAIPDMHFDDSVKYFSTVQTPLWKIADATGYHIVDLVNAGVTGHVGVGTSNPNTNAALDVSGVLRATGNIDASQFCPPGLTTNCFSPQHNITCPPGQAATAIPGGVSSVAGLGCTASTSVTCPIVGGVQEVMIGVDSSNRLLCAADSNCPVKTTKLCGANQTLSAASSNPPTTVTLSAGFNYQEVWQCSSGSWNRQSTSGICTCTAGSTTNGVTACDVQNGQGAGTFSGSYTTSTVTTCTPAYSVVTSTTNNCLCTNTSQTQTVNCQAGFTGGPVTQTRNWTCNVATNNGTWSSWVNTGGTPCTCVAGTTQTQTLSCPAGNSGTGIIQKSTFNCATNTWGPWVTTSNGCACTSPPAVNYQTIGCTAPLVGTQDQEQTFDCASSSWGPWVTYQNNCGSPTYIWQAVSNQTGPFGSPLSTTMGNTCTTPGATSSCSAAAGGGQYWHYDTCQCE